MPTHHPPPPYCFLDFEASSLGAGSFPIELGWATTDGHPGSLLVRPHETWDTDEGWSPLSAAVHGLKPEDLFDHGHPAEEVARHALAVAEGRRLVADQVAFDRVWLAILLETIGAPCPPVDDHKDACEVETARLLGLDLPPHLLRKVGGWRLQCSAARHGAMRAHPEPGHRAGPDARRLLAGFLAVRAAVGALVEQHS